MKNNTLHSHAHELQGGGAGGITDTVDPTYFTGTIEPSSFTGTIEPSSVLRKNSKEKPKPSPLLDDILVADAEASHPFLDVEDLEDHDESRARSPGSPS